MYDFCGRKIYAKLLYHKLLQIIHQSIFYHKGGIVCSRILTLTAGKAVRSASIGMIRQTNTSSPQMQPIYGSMKHLHAASV